MDAYREIWERIWKDTENTLQVKDLFFVMDQVKFSYVRQIMPRGAKTLEVGMGSARISSYLANEGCKVFGVDYSKHAINVARRNFKLSGLIGEFCMADAFNLPFPNGCFDMIFSTGLLEHFEKPLPIVAEMVRVLRAGGIFWSDIVPKKFSFLRSLDFLNTITKRDKIQIFERKFTRKEIESLLSTSGLKDIGVFAAGVFPPRRLILQRSETMQSLYGKFAQFLVPLLKLLDNTAIAEYLGFYYFCYGVKPRI